MELAAKYGLRDYPAPAGGCRLTEPNYASRLQDLKDHEGLTDLAAIRLLRVGRHFRLSSAVKAVIGRNQADNAFLDDHPAPGAFVLKADGVPGPTCILSAGASEEQVRLAASLCARYGDSQPDKPVAILVRSSQGVRRVEALRASQEEISRLMI